MKNKRGFIPLGLLTILFFFFVLSCYSQSYFSDDKVEVLPSYYQSSSLDDRSKLGVHSILDQTDEPKGLKKKTEEVQTAEAAHKQTQDAVRKITEDVARQQTDDAIRKITEDAARQQTEDAVRKVTEDTARKQTDDASKKQTEDALRKLTEDTARTPTVSTSVPQTTGGGNSFEPTATLTKTLRWCIFCGGKKPGTMTPNATLVPGEVAADDPSQPSPGGENSTGNGHSSTPALTSSPTTAPIVPPEEEGAGSLAYTAALLVFLLIIVLYALYKLVISRG